MRIPLVVLRLSDALLAQFASLEAVSISCSFLYMYSHTRLGQPANNQHIRFRVDQSRTVGLDIDLQHALAPNRSKSIRSTAMKFARAHKD